MAQENNDVLERLKLLETNVENIVETITKFAGEVNEIKSNLLMSSEVLNKLIQLKDIEGSCFKSFAKFVEDTLLAMERTDADKVVLEIVDVLCKYKKLDIKTDENNI